ncbi:PIR Superfamily Protein [Plasmodium ovale wallikeri]|uniref:PIR protein n=2 Tax=Plasmodium ovale TaxID=36330 RepID=A0A1C3KEW9_PLAOA|nr:PIR Superfamily Protein [Plasmodium ovale wallikeri]SBT72173.1 PIR protein [Plasmodium ovale]
MTGDDSEGTEDFSEIYLSGLPSVQFYKGVGKNHNNLQNYIQPCEQIKVKEKSDEVKTICKKFLWHLENSTVWDIEKPDYDICLLLNYWTYDKLNNIFSDKETSDKAFSNFQMISDYPQNYIKKNLYYKNKCKYNIDFHKYEDWQKRKEFYDYCVDYGTLNGLISTYNNKCNDFYKYVKKKEELYKHFEVLCSKEEIKCPKFYEECKKYNPNELLSILRCRDEMEQQKVPEKASAGHGTLGQDLEPGSREHGPGLPGIKGGTPDTESKQDSSEIGKKLGHSFLGIAPVMLAATALYRYTPVGEWIRNLAGTSPNSMSNINGEEMDGFFSDSENYISYQPI